MLARSVRPWVGDAAAIGRSRTRPFLGPEAELQRSGAADDICRTRVTVRLGGVPAASLLEAPLGNHLLLFHGRHRNRIERWWRLAFGQPSPSGE
jgi:hypothetical protein